MTRSASRAATGSARLVVGFRSILLTAENLPDRDWYVLDCFPLTSKTDCDLLLVVQHLRQVGYGLSYRVKAELSPAVFSPRGVTDREAIEAMERLARRGLAVSDRVTAIADAKFLALCDGVTTRARRYKR